MKWRPVLPAKRQFGGLVLVLALLLAVVTSAISDRLALAQTGQPGTIARTASSIQRALGSIKAITDNGITLASDGGEELRLTLQDSTRILRVAPGEKDLKNATPLQKQDLQVGDRILVRGKPGPDAHSMAAAAVIVMKQSDVAAKREKDREDWQKRGVGGLVTAVDPSTGAITISMTSFTGTKNVVIHTSKDTVLRRYAFDSVKFDDARLAPLDQIKVGDQLRARGTKNAEVTELSAEEVVSGTFRNLAGQIAAVDTSANTLTLRDVLSKQTVVVKVTGDAQLRKLPPEFAQRIALRLKGDMAAGIPGASAAVGGASQGAREKGSITGGGAGGMVGRSGGPPDIQQILNRMPPALLADLQKGDAVMIVSTQGDGSGTVNAITLLA
ncbi:MAG: hypothetical protein WA628_26155, partial [Terriglobales bacterium]